MQSTGQVMPEYAAEVAYDASSLIIAGQRVFLRSAAIHYFRMPREEWREVLVKAKLSGMNCIDTYVAWNVHEPEEGQWSFEGDRDCGAFLDLCHELGLWVIARPGPFICAEWDMGGFPYWLGSQPGIAYRTLNDVYLRYADRYLERILPIIAERQATRGGAVLLVQVENELGYLADGEAGQAYMEHLRAVMLRHRIKVPLITCYGGLADTIEGANFWSGADQHYARLQEQQPDAPKLVTEFWTGWFDHWGAPASVHKTPQLYEKRIMEAIRAGFTGLNHYMFFGGTNFGSMGGRTVGGSDIFMITSYDYHAPLDEYGRGRDKYATVKKLNYFIAALGEWLLQATPCEVSGIRHSHGIAVRGSTHGGQMLLYIESRREERACYEVTLPGGRTWPVMAGPGQVVPLLDGYRVMDGLRLTCNTWIAGNEVLNGSRTLFVSAPGGQRSRVELYAEDDANLEIKVTKAAPVLYCQAADRRRLTLELHHFEEPQLIELLAGKLPLRLVVLSERMLERTWRWETERGTEWLIGADDLEPGSAATRWRVALAEDSARRLHILDSCSSGEPKVLECPLSLMPNHHAAMPQLAVWQRQSVSLAADLGAATRQPLGFTEYGQCGGHLLYSCSIRGAQEGEETTIIVPALEDSCRVYLNGQEQQLIRDTGAAAIRLVLSKGNHLLQLLVQSMGRLNFSPYLGEAKGITGPVYRDGTAVDLRSGWSCGEEQVHLNEVLHQEQGARFVRSFEVPAGHDQALLVGSLSDHVVVNGCNVPMDGFQSWFAFHKVDLSAYIRPGENTIELGAHEGPMPRLELYTFASGHMLDGWHMRAIQPPQQWSAAEEQVEEQAHGSAWYRTVFGKVESDGSRKLRLKLRLTGMSKGEAWLNGRSLGRYWQIGPQEDYKLPLSWLQECNELLIFDEEGRLPSRVRLLADEQSFWQWHDQSEWIDEEARG